ncbi:unnamed protein product [Rotaria sp. Silwood2]|nr:unnamed protein product [Rotaria sp. Silwood2]
MINPHNVVDILSNFISDRLKLTSTPVNTRRDEEVAKMLFENIDSVMNCTSYSFENDHTLDFDFDIELIDEEMTSDEGDNDNLHDNDEYDEYEKENIVHEQFSLEYMKRVIKFYDEKDEKTGKRKHSFLSVKRHFKQVKHKNYILRFQKYIETQGTKRQKLDQNSSFVYQSFQNARQQLLPVHDIDIKAWALKKASELGDHIFVASDHWVYDFKRHHNIV